MRIRARAATRGDAHTQRDQCETTRDVEMHLPDIFSNFSRVSVDACQGQMSDSSTFGLGKLENNLDKNHASVKSVKFPVEVGEKHSGNDSTCLE